MYKNNNKTDSLNEVNIMIIKKSWIDSWPAIILTVLMGAAVGGIISHIIFLFKTSGMNDAMITGITVGAIGGYFISIFLSLFLSLSEEKRR